MALTRKDAFATVLTALAVLALLATQNGWDVWLIGDSRRWAAGVVFLLGALTCGLGSPSKGVTTVLLAGLGVAALALAMLAVATGSLAALTLLVADIVALWGASTLRHALGPPRKPIAT